MRITDAISPAELRHWSTRSNCRGTRIVAANWAMIAAIFAGVALWTNPLSVLLGIFLLAFYVKRVGGTATFLAALLAEIGVVWCFLATDISYLWYNVDGCVLAVAFALLLQPFVGRRPTRSGA